MAITISGNGIVEANIADGAVTSDKLSAESVDSDQYVDGSVDTIHIGDDQVTGAKLNPALVTGDVIYADGTDTITRLAKPASPAGEVLTFATSATAPSWVAPATGGTTYFLGSLSRAGNGAAGSVSYTGVGFEPDIVMFLSAQDGVTGMTVGWSDATTDHGLTINNTTPHFTAQRGHQVDQPTNGEQYCNVTSMDSDGFTVAWANPAGPPPSTTIHVRYLALKF